MAPRFLRAWACVNSKKTFSHLVAIVALLTVLSPLLGSHDANAQGALSLIQAAEGDKTETAPEPAAKSEDPASNPPTKTPSMMMDVDMVSNQAMSARNEFEAIVKALPFFLTSMETTLRAQSPDSSLSWIGGALVRIAVAIAAGFLAMGLLARWARPKFAYLYRDDVFYRADKISYLLVRTLMMIGGLVVFVVVAGLVSVVLNGEQGAPRQTAIVVLTAMLLFLFVRMVFFNILVPDAASHRLIALSDHEARALYRSLIVGAAVSAAVLAVCNWMQRLGLPEEPHKLALIGAAFLSMLILSGIAIAFRHVIGRLFMGKYSAGEALPLWRRILAQGWHIIAVVYFIVAFAISSIRILLDLPDATGLVVAPLQVMLIAALIYGLLILVIDRLLLPRLDTPKKQAALAADMMRTEETEGEDPDAEELAAQAEAEAADREAYRTPFRALLDHGAKILVLFAAAYLLALTWGIPLAGNQSFISSIIDVLLVGFLGYMAYQAVKLVIDQQIAKESPAEKDEEAEVGGAGESRIATLLPIFRNFLLITIVAIAAMVILSELGVNIGPLFAGAGVVGLAIGFGAQTLIRDIFSGAFYLLDDAFRKGEYIDIGSAKGVVEKISIRSMQLRHHRGALTTIPFGEIQHVENFSRDWAMMKLAFRVTYDTDVEKMRKIIKNFGQELMADEYYGPMFLQPLKSQGIMAFEDSAMIARVKFMTKPGKQFELRKVVYAGLQDLFEKNGIKFAHKQVTVRVATGDEEEENSRPAISKEALKAAAAAGAGAAGALPEDNENGDQSAADQL
ncbi:small-conductance mechanosensitive channel [Roseibium hamelinense]|uniref:Small-conductance mechanosensitive channel n=1 Tax=Roseibium hamelinense TaxID=150831 RepID=A0A562T959_9HYPH|nr:mechanosensitive ion channel family protein [Roseibium hamelinense]MTI45475.1 mechanosensitive ion channel [Roseibium hamelinense]TWI90151.1 small-conductance mechanosensitive channel [Roseibium hamelinense]